MSRFWTGVVDTIGQLLPLPLVVLIMLAVAAIIGALWYFFPSWVPRRLPRFGKARSSRVEAEVSPAGLSELGENDQVYGQIERYQHGRDHHPGERQHGRRAGTDVDRPVSDRRYGSNRGATLLSQSTDLGVNG